MNNVMAMEPESTTTLTELAGLIKEYWGYLLGFTAAAVTVWGFFRKCRGKYVAFREFITLAVNAPYSVVAIQRELQFENGVSLRDRLIALGDDVIGLRRLVAAETNSRRVTLQAVDTPIFECNHEGKFLWVNDAFLDLANREIHQMIGSQWRNSIATPDRDRTIDEFERSVRDGTDCRIKFRLTTGDETETYVLFEAICNKDDLGNVLGFIGKIRTIKDPRTMHATEG